MPKTQVQRASPRLALGSGRARRATARPGILEPRTAGAMAGQRAVGASFRRGFRFTQKKYSVLRVRSPLRSAPSIDSFRSIGVLRRLRRARRPASSAVHPSRTSGIYFEAVSEPAQFQARTPEAILVVSMNAGATRFDRFDSLFGSIDTA
eukprot:13355940-Alexandrium_andersonii.AAC.1